MQHLRSGRAVDQLRPLSLTCNYLAHAEGSCLIEAGLTRVICSVSLEEKVPHWLQDKGWITAEYGMLPRATQARNRRDHLASAGRTQEIQRLIGRSLRAVTDLKALGQRKLIVDCDVLQADAGTRTAAITGSWLALALACDKLRQAGKLTRWPLKDQVAAISLGLLGEEILLDMDFAEDREAAVDLNLVMTASGQLVEVQASGEEAVFSRDQLDRLLDLGWRGLQPIFALQQQTLSERGVVWTA